MSLRLAPGADPKPRVTLTLYPKGYQAHPTLPYDIHEELQEGAKVQGEAGRMHVRVLRTEETGRRGEVTLSVR